jgi:hypothetical protein
MSNEARRYHERLEFRKLVLLGNEKFPGLRSGSRISECDFREYRVGRSGNKKINSRLAAVINALVLQHGFDIKSFTSEDTLYYFMPNPNQYPTLWKVNQSIKNAYWKWKGFLKKRDARFEIDGHACVQCKSTENLQCHHTSYDRIFCEDELLDLLTFCSGCHTRFHNKARLKFPGGLPFNQVELLGFDTSRIADWLKPINPDTEDPNFRPVQNFIPGLGILSHDH